jgi:hypothetical protein
MNSYPVNEVCAKPPDDPAPLEGRDVYGSSGRTAARVVARASFWRV